jgi:hypothetical protein
LIIFRDFSEEKGAESTNIKRLNFGGGARKTDMIAALIHFGEENPDTAPCIARKEIMRS